MTRKEIIQWLRDFAQSEHDVDSFSSHSYEQGCDNGRNESGERLSALLDLFEENIDKPVEEVKARRFYPYAFRM